MTTEFIIIVASVIMVCIASFILAQTKNGHDVGMLNIQPVYIFSATEYNSLILEPQKQYPRFEVVDNTHYTSTDQSSLRSIANN